MIKDNLMDLEEFQNEESFDRHSGGAAGASAAARSAFADSEFAAH